MAFLHEEEEDDHNNTSLAWPDPFRAGLPTLLEALGGPRGKGLATRDYNDTDERKEYGAHRGQILVRTSKGTSHW